MSYKERAKLYEELESIRGRHLLVYVTSIRPGVNASMEQTVIPMIINQINKFNKKESIDLLIISNGGDPLVSWRINSLLREKFKNVSVLIPYTAFSAATLLALGADEILMHPFGNLGPLDPQLTFTNNGKAKTISYEDITKYMEFVKDIGICDQASLQKSFEKLTNEIMPTQIGFAKKSSQLGLTMGQKLLEMHMSDTNRAKEISEILNTKYYHHGYSLSRSEAKNIGLPIADSNEKVESIIWKIYEDFTKEMEFNKIFDPQGIITNSILKKDKPKPDIIYTIKQNMKIVSLESIYNNCYYSAELLATYSMTPDTTLNSNISFSRGDWIIKKREE